MRRLIASIARGALLLLGAACLLCIPVSFLAPLRADVPIAPPSPRSAILVLRGGAFEVHYFYNSWGGNDVLSWHVIEREDPDDPVLSDGWLLPQFTRTPPPHRDQWGHVYIETRLWFPLWLLAAVCLAWPARSLVLARRRRRVPGFEVQTTPAAQDTAPSGSPAQRPG